MLRAVRRLVLPLLLLVFWAGDAAGEEVYRGTPVSDARLALGPGDVPVVAYVADGALTVAVRRAAGWDARSRFVLPAREVEIDGLAVSTAGLPSVLLRARDGRWLGVARSAGSGNWRWQAIRPDGPRDLIGPAGLALDLHGRPVVAYALWHRSHRTVLRLVRTDARGAFRTQAVTRNGFPETPTLAGAAPVVMPNGQIRVIETFTPAAIEWSPIPRDWIGQFLHSSALGFPTGAVATAVAGSTVYAAWTDAFPTLGPPAVVLASHGSHAQGAVAIENAVLAALVVTPAGPELAANRCAGESCLGLVGDIGLDGVVAGYAAERGGARELLLATDAGLDWLRTPLPLAAHVSLGKDLTGRVQGATSGAVALYRETADGSRTFVGSFPLAADGSFAASDTGATPAAAYRAVWVEPSTSIPYAALLSTGT
jgi:hypothetical protein